MSKITSPLNQIFYHSSTDMREVSDNSVDLIITSPPYFNIKDYAKNGYQNATHSKSIKGDLGGINDYNAYIKALLGVWKECVRILKPNGKLCVNVPLMPMLKKDLDTHYNRHIFDLQSDIQHSILRHTGLFLLDMYIWNRTNSSKKLMFGSYPYPRNFYAQNTTEFITVYVKDGKPRNSIPQEIKEASKLTQEEWVSFTKQIWDLPAPNKSDIAFGKHSAIMPEAIPYRLIKLFSFVGDVVCDPFAGSGTTLKVAKELGRNFVGYEIYPHYKAVIEEKLDIAKEVITKEVSEESAKVAASIAKELLKSMSGNLDVIIKVNPADFEFLNNLAKGKENIKIKSDDAIAKGGVVIISENGNIDGSIMSRYKLLKQSVIENLKGF